MLKHDLTKCRRTRRDGWRFVRGTVALLWLSSGLRADEFSITNIVREAPGVIRLSWPTTPGTSYQIQTLDEWTNSWADVPDGHLVAGVEEFGLSWTNQPASDLCQRFYRLRVKQTPVLLALILDRSGSMAVSGAWEILPPVVDVFLERLAPTRDRVALITFATTVRVDFPMGQPFVSQIKSNVPRLQAGYQGATGMEGGLAAGFAAITNALGVTPVIPAVVLFTDGGANQIQETVDCPPVQTLMLGGFDAGPTYSLMPTNSDSTVLCTATGVPACCAGLTQFTSVLGGTRTISAENLRQEARVRTLTTARAMQAAGITIYCIGYGPATSSIALQQLANDPASAGYDPSLPPGLAVIATTSEGLANAFKSIAAALNTRASQ